jgi:hypothetical protein
MIFLYCDFGLALRVLVGREIGYLLVTCVMNDILDEPGEFLGNSVEFDEYRDGLTKIKKA